MRIRFPLLVGLAVVTLCSISQAGPVPTQPIFTNKTRFRIPYRYDAAEMQQLGAREIQLFVSVDRGSQWQKVESVTPEMGHFEFQAPQDGEYWFAVRTLDQRNQLHPDAKIIEPGLKVIVDTTPPVLGLHLRQEEPGKVTLSWNATDLHLDPSTLRLGYIQPGLADWQQVTVAPQVNGQTSWSVPDGGIVAVRGSISDAATNTGQSQMQVRVNPADQAEPLPRIPNVRQPIATIAPNPRSSFISNSSDSLVETQPADLSTTTVTPPAPRNNDPFQSWPPKPASTKNMKPRGTSADRPPESTNDSSDRKRVVNSTHFQINYRIDEIGPSGVSRVELFITQNNGQKWWNYGDDLDLQSPFPIEVPGDGVYGFTLRIHSGVGLADAAPKPGEEPSMVIVVDQTPPVISLLPVRQGQGANLNKVLIEWTMADENPAEKPVALYYSTHPDGPWEPISGWQPNTGSYLWAVTPGLPSRMYVQLMARDAAGNISRAATPQPVLVDLTRPTAHIINVETVATGVKY